MQGFFSSTSVIAILKSPLNLVFISSKNTKPRWLNLLSTICFNQKGRFNYMLSRLFWCKNGATLCAMIFTISHDTTRKRTKSLRYRTLFTIFNAIYAMSITARDNFCLLATLKNPDTIKVFGVFLFYQCSVWCKFGASLLIVSTHAKKVFTNSSFCDIIKLVRYLIDKLEFVGVFI